MELGSEICHPKRPQCLICPIRDLCPTAIKGLQESIPVAAKKVKYQELNEAVVVIRRGNKFLVRQCGADERWAGLWDFPRYEIGGAIGQLGPSESRTQQSQTISKSTAKTRLKRVDWSGLPEQPEQLKLAIAKAVKQQTGLAVSLDKTPKQIKHAVTKYRIKLDCYVSTKVSGRLKQSRQSRQNKRNSDLQWMTISQVHAAPMSVTGRKIASWIDEAQ